MDRLGRTRVWLADQFTPSVAVIASQEADSLCHAANGLSVVNLLRPFGVLNQLNGTIGVPVRTVGEAPFRLHSWRLRFYAANTMFQPAAEAADGHLKEVLSAAAATACDESVPPLEVLLSPDCGDATPWYGIYRDEFVRLMAFGDHETMDHPVACVLVLPSTVQGDPVAAFEELFARPGSLPALMQQGVMEPRIPKHYVLLHDARTAPPGTLERAQNLLRHMVGSVGQQCHLLVINSRSEEQPAGIDQRFWSAALPGTVPGGGAGEPASYPAPPPGVAFGAGLSDRDVRGLSDFARNLAVQHIIPNLETRIRALNHQVTSTRKGLRNQLKSLLWRKAGPSSFLAAAAGVGATDSPSSTAPSTPTAAAGTAGGGAAGGQLPGAYLHSSVEGEMRALSDLALLLRDFETALGTLRLLASDYKQDKAWKHYAAVQEALGVATILSAGSPADAVASYKEAFYRYQQVAQLGGRYRIEGTRYATRAAMVLLEYLRAIGQHGEANWICMKAHFQEENLRAGLLLEQAAHSLLRLAPAPHVRKFAFHLVLAGLRFNLCEQKGLALRAYKQVLGVYSGRRWALIEEHLHDVLGRQSREAGDWLGAVQHYMAMVLCPANSLYCQRAYMAQFLEVLRAAQAQLGYDPTLELPVPVINLERVGLQYDSQTGYGTPEARQVGGEVWRPLEAAVQPPAEGGPLTWLDGGSRAHMAHQQPEHTCIVGETVGIDIELSNPLQVDLALTRLRLACSFEPATAAAASAAQSSTAAAGAVASGADRPKNSGLQIREESLTLGPGERMVVQLRLVPLRAGSLTVEGVQWVLSGLAQGCQRFRIPRPKPRKPGSSKPLLDAAREPPGGVHFTVLPPMPHLEVTTPPLPPVMLVGELLQCPLRLRNTGAMTMHNIAMAVATPDMLLTAVEVLPAPPAAAAAAPAGPDISGGAVGTVTGSSTGSNPGFNCTSFDSQTAAVGLNGDREAPEHAQQQQQQASPNSSAHAAGPTSATSAMGDGDNLSHQLEGLALATSARSSPIGTPLAALATDPGLAGAPTLHAPQFRAAGAGAAQPGAGLGLPPRGPRPRGTSGVVEVVVSERPGGMTVFSLPPGSNKLGVGQELQLLLWFRPTQAGAVRFNSVWCYEPVVKLDSVRFRTLRVTYSAAVQPSLDLAAAAVAGRSVPGTCLLQLRGVNRQGVEALRLTELACPGEAWQLSRLNQAQQAQHQQQQQTGGGGSSRQELDTIVGPESAVTLHYHLMPADSAAAVAAAPGVEPPASGLCGAALSSAVSQWFFRRAHPRRRVVPSAPSTTSLQSAATGRSTWQQTSAAASVVEDGVELGGSGAGELSAPLDLVVRWEVAGSPAGAQPRCGFHVLYQQRVQEGPPIHVQLLGPGRVVHDFDSAPFCTLQLVLRVRNTLPSPAAVCVETGKGPDGRPTPLGMASWAPSPAPSDGSMPSSGGSSSGGYVQPVRPHIWCGRTRVTLPELPSCQTVEVPLHVAASEPGMLHLADYLISWSYPEAPALNGSRPGPPCVVEVEQRRRQQVQQQQPGGGG